MTPTRVLIQRLDPGLPLPSRGNPGDAGWDLFAREDAHLTPGERLVIPTGVAIALEPGFVGLVHPCPARPTRCNPLATDVGD